MPNPPKNLNEFSSLIQLIKDLRGPNGCPWDKEQSHLSLAPYAIEETFEMVEALEKADDDETCEELGDVLFQIVLHSELASERGAFNINDVIQKIAEKIVRRHPHVFANVQVANSEEVITNWNAIKAQEKNGKIKPIFNMPKGLPALQSADKIGKKTEDLKFDWNNPRDVLKHLKSEIQELEDELNQSEQNEKAISHEMGDILFTAAQLARHLNLDSEGTLRQANLRFCSRFNTVLDYCDKDLNKFKNLDSATKEKLWKQAKNKS